MKKKNLLPKSLVATIFLGFMFCSSNVFSQGKPWKLDGNNNVHDGNFIGTTNNQDFVVKTNNLERMRITTDDYTIFEDSVKIKGPLHIGDSSLIIGGSGLPFPGDAIQSSNGEIYFGHTGFLSFFSYIKIGVGTTSPKHKLHLHDRNPIYSIPGPGEQPKPVKMAFTNEAQAGGTGILDTDGFLLGIASDGTAEINQQEDSDIRIFTNAGANNDQRMIISHDDVTNDPRVGIGNNNLSNPRTFLHIGYNITNNSGYRDWMNVGEIAVNGKGDNMYFGFLYGSSDHVINWGSEAIQNEKNRLRFVNTTNPSNTETSGEPTGLEIARMVAIDGTDGRMGIGDFFSASGDPTETLDVIGNARIREVPPGDYNRVLVIDDSGVLHWRDMTGISGAGLGNDCALNPGDPGYNPLISDWEIPLEGHNFVFSGQGPLATNSVGIGIDGCEPQAKLEVLRQNGLDQIGILATAEAGLPGPELLQIGVRGEAIDPDPEIKFNIGVHGLAHGNAYSSIGVLGQANVFNINVASCGGLFYSDNIGVFADGDHYAGYFDGNVYVAGDFTNPGSDAMFKDSVNDITDGLNTIRNLQPRSFKFKTDEFNYMNLPDGTNFGLIAQEVEPILPEIVKEIHHPAQYDSSGNEISPELDFKALTYNSLIPITISAVQELDDTIQKIVAKPDIPILIAPENNDTILAKEIPEFVWHQADHAQFYTIKFSYTSDMSDVFKSATTVDTLINPRIPINNDTTVYWAVKAYNTFGESDYSEIRYVFCAYGFDNTKAQSYSKLSDANLKTNINDIDDALQKTMQLNGVSFEWDTEQSPDRNLEPGTNFGIIAQEIQPIFPEVVKTDENGFLYIDYTSLVPVLVEALKEQQTQINLLQQQMNDLASVVDDCCGDPDKSSYNDDTGENGKPAFSQDV